MNIKKENIVNETGKLWYNKKKKIEVEKLMSRETEKMNKALQKFLDANTTEKMTEDEMDILMKIFIKEYNEMNANFVLDARTAKTSDDFYELAKMTEELSLSLKYAKKSLKLDPENLDAAFFIAEIEADSYIDLIERTEKILQHGEKIMIEKEFMDKENIGSFWLMVETRPYMRIKFEYAKFLKECGMLSTAIFECEDMIKLCKNDNLGVRHTLMYLYAVTENNKKDSNEELNPLQNCLIYIFFYISYISI